MHRNSAPVTITTGHMHLDRPSPWTATPGKLIPCRDGFNGQYLHCACITDFTVYSVCEDRKWRCTENVCDGVCRTVGEGHYISFDGLKYSFPGLCQYVLVQVRDRDIAKISRVYCSVRQYRKMQYATVRFKLNFSSIVGNSSKKTSNKADYNN